MTRLHALIFPLLVSLGAAAADYDINAPGRVVAFGDVHGAYTDWVALLQERLDQQQLDLKY